MTTEYYQLAERIGNDLNGCWYCCADLPDKEAAEFAAMYEDDARASEIHTAGWAVWMADYNTTSEQDNALRVLALLLMHEMTVNP